MKRTLRRKIKKKNSESKSEPLNFTPKRKRIKRYKKQRCVYILEGGLQCSSYAVGKGTLCKKHGGNPIIKENLVNESEASLIIGKRTKYNPETHPILYIHFAKRGFSEVEIAAEFKVSVETLHNWAERYVIFNEAYEIGKALHEAWWLEQGKANLENRSFNTTLYKFLTSNKLGYSDKMESKSLNMNIHGVLKVPDRVSEEEWESDIIDIE